MTPRRAWVVALWLTVLAGAAPVRAQSPAPGGIAGVVTDAGGGVLPGVTVEIEPDGGSPVIAVTDGRGAYRIEPLAPGRYIVSFSLVNFAPAVRRDVDVAPAATARVGAVLHLALSADVVVTGKRTFVNLADVENPAENLVGIAQSASQGAITAAQLDARPIERAGEVLETVPGVIISQHSGEGKANQYYLRGFNLDHGTDFAATVAGIPTNLPSHAHGHGYLDLNFLIPELVSGVQFSKGPYFAEQGDFATAGAANVNYTDALDRPLVRVTAGGGRYARAVAAASPRLADGHLLAALEVGHNDGPWERPDDFRKVNGVVRYSRGDAMNAFAITALGYRATWNATDQVPARALASGAVGRFGAIDGTDGGNTYRYAAVAEWQKSAANRSTRVSAYGVAYDLDLFSNFTYYLDDPVRGDQFQQADHRFVSGGRIAHRAIGRWRGRAFQSSFGVHLRNDDITTVGLYHTRARQRLDTVREDAVLQTSVGVYAQNEMEWAPWLRSTVGLRADGTRFDVRAGDPENGGIARAGLLSPKAGLVFGPWRSTELYANAGDGFHSNDARGTTITRDPRTGDAVDRVTPLVRARAAEAGFRSVLVPKLQTSVAWWRLALDSELVFVGDAGTTEAGRPSRRSGVEWANYYRPRPWLVVDGDVAWSRARFTDGEAGSRAIPGAVETVVSLGVTVDDVHRWFGSARLRSFGPRPLVEDDSIRSQATRLVNVEAGYALRKGLRIAADVFNALNTPASDIDYFYRSRLPGELPGGVDDVHLHPALPRTARLSVIVGF